MPIFNVVRARRNREGYMENLISNMYTEESVIYRMGYGICAVNADTIISSFYYTRNTFCSNNSIKVHQMEIYIEKEFGIEETIRIADAFGSYILGLGFQVFTSTLDSDNYYLITIAVNAISFMNGKAFHDNNMQYVNICNYLKSIVPYDWEFEVTDNTFFNPEDGSNNYIHGILM